jgi:hypothetical protein
MLRYGENPFIPDEIKAGDIIGFSGDSWISALVNMATYGLPFWGLSHVGIIGRADDGRLMLFESTQLDDLPCEISGEVFVGTQAHQLEHVVEVYKGKVWRYPLYRPLYPTEDERLTDFLMATIHTPYDKLGAIRSAGVGLSWVESLLYPDNLNSIFCSELVAAAYACVGLWATAHVARWNPNRLARWLRAAGVLRKPWRLK